MAKPIYSVPYDSELPEELQKAIMSPEMQSIIEENHRHPLADESTEEIKDNDQWVAELEQKQLMRKIDVKEEHSESK